MSVKSTAFSFFTFSLLALSAVSGGAAADTDFILDDPTGICYRDIAWSDDESLHHRYELVLVKQSSTLSKDMERLKIAEELAHTSVRDPDMVPFVWLGAWIDDNTFIEGEGPDCSSLPDIEDR